MTIGNRLHFLHVSLYFFLTIYLIGCFLDYNLRPPPVGKVLGIKIVSLDRKEKIIPLSSRPLTMKSTDTLSVTIQVDRRRSGWTVVERTFRVAKNGEREAVEYILNGYRKWVETTTTKNTILEIRYHIPNVSNFPKGCLYEVATRSTVTYAYNVLTYFLPHVRYDPVIPVCLE